MKCETVEANYGSQARNTISSHDKVCNPLWVNSTLFSRIDTGFSIWQIQWTPWTKIQLDVNRNNWLYRSVGDKKKQFWKQTLNSESLHNTVWHNPIKNYRLSCLYVKLTVGTTVWHLWLQLYNSWICAFGKARSHVGQTKSSLKLHRNSNRIHCTHTRARDIANIWLCQERRIQ